MKRTQKMKKVLVLSEYSAEIIKAISGKFSIVGAIENGNDDIFCATVDGKSVSRASLPTGIKILAVFRADEKIEGDFDDFIVRPCSHGEISARISRLSDASKLSKSSERPFKNGTLVIDFEKCTVMLGGKSVHLTMLEYRLLCLLAKNIGSTVSYDEILSALWGSPIGTEIKSLRVLVNAIRTKLDKYGKEHIKTVSGKGYILVQCLV